MTGSIFEKLNRVLAGKVLQNEPLAKHTTWRIGGPAELFIVPTGLSELQTALCLLQESGVPWIAIGAGSNLLVRDGGIRGAVIQSGNLRELGFESGGVVNVGGGLPLMTLVRETACRGLAGLERLAGIPGTLGGGVVMNAGACGQDLSGVVRSVTLAGPGGEEEIDAERLQFGYRRSSLPQGCVVTAAQLQLSPAEPAMLAEEIRKRIRNRQEAQRVGAPNAGSVFKNPLGFQAWRLIDEAGLRGMTIGGARVAERHANFILNLGGATARDILQLIDHVRATVFKRTGIDLEPEVRIVGEDQEG